MELLHFQNIESEVALKKEQEAAKRETERVCSSIQTMCRSTQFLAKNLDYVQENVDAMQAELIFWRQESRKYMQACEEERRCVCVCACAAYGGLASEPALGRRRRPDVSCVSCAPGQRKRLWSRAALTCWIWSSRSRTRGARFGPRGPTFWRTKRSVKSYWGESASITVPKRLISKQFLFRRKREELFILTPTRLVTRLIFLSLLEEEPFGSSAPLKSYI